MNRKFKESLADGQKRLRLVCQHCGKINKTKHLDYDTLCYYCHKWAKRSWQKVRASKKQDKSNKITMTVYSVLNSQKEAIPA